ncbi:MAG TPA: type I phosphomannose isomerase catalytic subunit [Tepidisphaeraceae bacterium]
MYPLKFKPRLVEKIWGGRKLQSVLKKDLPVEKPIGESWELYDFPPGVISGEEGWVSSVVANGPLAGKTLHELSEQFGAELMGDVQLNAQGQFPLLIKFLDAREDLSVQVHPPAEYAAAHPGAYLKTEAWYVMQSDPGARIYKGVQTGVNREHFHESLKAGEMERDLVSIPVKEGDCHFLPSGTVHALGAGILAAEVQTPSDTTFRVFDFNRIDRTTGKPRTLHIEQALECIDFSGRVVAQPRSHVAGYWTTVTRLVTSEFFKIEKVRFVEGFEEALPYDQPVIWMMLEGELELRVTDQREPVRVKKGETVLLPAKMDRPTLRTLSDCSLLEVTFPAR